MIHLIIWLAAFLCTNPNHTANKQGRVTVTATSNAEGDTGGETEGHPTTPPPPPPPPPGY